MILLHMILQRNPTRTKGLLAFNTIATKWSHPKYKKTGVVMERKFFPRIRNQGSTSIWNDNSARICSRGIILFVGIRCAVLGPGNSVLTSLCLLGVGVSWKKRWPLHRRWIVVCSWKMNYFCCEAEHSKFENDRKVYVSKKTMLFEWNLSWGKVDTLLFAGKSSSRTSKTYQGLHKPRRKYGVDHDNNQSSINTWDIKSLQHYVNL